MHAISTGGSLTMTLNPRICLYHVSRMHTPCLQVANIYLVPSGKRDGYRIFTWDCWSQHIWGICGVQISVTKIEQFQFKHANSCQSRVIYNNQARKLNYPTTNTQRLILLRDIRGDAGCIVPHSNVSAVKCYGTLHGVLWLSSGNYVKHGNITKCTQSRYLRSGRLLWQLLGYGVTFSLVTIYYRSVFIFRNDSQENGVTVSFKNCFFMEICINSIWMI